MDIATFLTHATASMDLMGKTAQKLSPIHFVKMEWHSQQKSLVCASNQKRENLCDRPVCKEGCSKKHGYCNEPNQCLCELGWKGDYCNTCAPYPGCKHGDCKKPWECNCYDGWQGTFCNETIEAATTTSWKTLVIKNEKDKTKEAEDEMEELKINEQIEKNDIVDKKKDDEETKENLPFTLDQY